MMAVPDASLAGQDSIITHFVDSVFNEIQGGKSFAEVANSLNPQSNGGDVGWAREIDLVQVSAEVVKAAFSAPVGKAFKVKVPGQQLILQVEERTARSRNTRLPLLSCRS